MLFGVKIL